MASIIEGSLHVKERFSCKLFTPPANSISNDAVASDANIDAAKMRHQHEVNYTQPNSAATSVTQVLHCARDEGAVVAFRAGSIAANVGDATVTVDLKKNGASILSAPIELDNSHTAREVVEGTIPDGTLAADDVLEIVTVATIGTGTLATGLFCQAVIRTKP